MRAQVRVPLQSPLRIPLRRPRLRHEAPELGARRIARTQPEQGRTARDRIEFFRRLGRVGGGDRVRGRRVRGDLAVLGFVGVHGCGCGVGVRPAVRHVFGGWGWWKR